MGLGAPTGPPARGLGDLCSHRQAASAVEATKSGLRSSAMIRQTCPSADEVRQAVAIYEAGLSTRIIA